MPKSNEVLKRLKSDGWFADRQKGSHVILKHPTKRGFIVFPNHGSAEIGTGLMNVILKKAGLK